MLIVIGHKGSGKTSVGSLLAHQYGYCWHDSDQVMLQQTKAPSIRSLYRQLGAEQFRLLESQVVLSLLQQPCQILTLGAGALINAEVRHCCQAFQVLQLYVAAPELYRRWQQQQLFPDFLPADCDFSEFLSHFQERDLDYRQVTSQQLDVTHQALAEIVLKLLPWLEA